MNLRTTAIAALLAVVTGMAIGSPANAEPARPATPVPAAEPGQPAPGWSDARRGGERLLTWRASAKLPMGDATVEFYAGDRLLGRPRGAADLRTFTLEVGDTRAVDLSTLQVRAGGRRLDGAPAAPRPALKVTRKAAPAAPVSEDPGVPGPYPTVTGEYTLEPVTLPGFPQPVEMQGVVAGPKGAPGERPLVLLLHGRHFTCFAGADAGKISGEWPCPAGSEPVPSHRGFPELQRLLASQGYVTVSISANGVNAQDGLADDGGAQARSSLIRLHLARWAQWAGAQRSSAPEIVRSVPPADLSQVLLAGHSRGADGVNRAALDSLSPPPADRDGYHGAVRWTVRGTVLLAPTLRGHNPVPDLPSVTVLPGCDGDVADLQGQMAVDATRGVSRGRALHSALYVVGANHNFFNTEWTPGQAEAPAFDDASSMDSACRTGSAPGRLTAATQQRVAATYLSAAARLFITGDDAVRGLLDGSGLRAPSADPARVLHHALGGNRTPVLLPTATTPVSGARLCAEVTPDPAAVCLPPGRYNPPSPHFVQFAGGTDPDRYAVALTWSRAGEPVTMRPPAPVSVRDATDLALRLIVAPNLVGARMDVAVTDAAGHRASLGEVTADGLPSSGLTTAHWAQEVRVPLSAAARAGVDLDAIAELELVPRSASGQAWLIDAWGWRAGTPLPGPVALPRVDVGHVTVDEGDGGARTVRIPVTVTGGGAGEVTAFLSDSGTSATTATRIAVAAGSTTVDVPITVDGNARYGYDHGYGLRVRALRGVVVGAYDGGLLVRDDDPVPAVTASPPVRASEGEPLRWRLALSSPADCPISIGYSAEAPAGGSEVSTADVEPGWLFDLTGQQPAPARPLSDTGLRASLVVPAGADGVDLVVPTVADDAAEPERTVRFTTTYSGLDAAVYLPGPEVSGTLTDRP
ncbi:hypothetical protein AB0J80_31255 [Actinoplanes sp. NPDC049548]|uniref:hypothetical protein n=1 Tax=Actinoplanes sp. NPDC049548 TaxID=3155152 RepID=UPI0034377C3C